MGLYQMINLFFLYSFLGYLLECAVLSFENRRPVMDRGFGHGPFCVIYGVGALGAYILLSPMVGRPVELYTASMAMATTMELFTANIMIRLFGAFWWDYSRKPFNYRGIICLESSLAWGFLGLFFFYFLDARVRQAVVADSRPCGKRAGRGPYRILSGGFHRLRPGPSGRRGG